MKNLRHPNIVKLVGVCWDDSMFACCLEYIDNGTLEDWLRKTVKTAKKQQQKKKTKTKPSPALPPRELTLSEVFFKGYDASVCVDSNLTLEQLVLSDSILKRVAKCSEECLSFPEKFKWSPILNEDHSPLHRGIKSFSRYSSSTHFGQAFAYAEVHARPAQVFAHYRDPRFSGSDDLSTTETLEMSSTSSLQYMYSQQSTAGVSDRDLLWRGVVRKLPNGGGIAELTYSTEDARKPVLPGVVRMEMEFAMICREKEESGGQVTEVLRYSRINPKMGGLATLVNGLVAKKAASAVSGPLVKQKGDILEFFEQKKGMRGITEATFKGYDHGKDNKYNAALHTDLDVRNIKYIKNLVFRYADECFSEQRWESNARRVSGVQARVSLGSIRSGTSMGIWMECEELELGVRHCFRYNTKEKCGEAIAMAEVAATPEQIFGYHDYPGRFSNTGVECLERYNQARLNYKFSKKEGGLKASLMSDRDILFRTVIKKMEHGGWLEAGYSVEDAMRPITVGTKRIEMKGGLLAMTKAGEEEGISVVYRYARIDPKFAIKGVQSYVSKKLMGMAAGPLVELKRNVERLVGEYEPVLESEEGEGKAEEEGGMTWKGQLLKIATECALGVQYLHNERYWSDDEGIFKECIIHRDLKPENMLLTREWSLKLTDFGEARAADLSHTMTSVGTPIYVAPEVMRGNQYDSKCDSYSFGICLVAMCR